MKQLKVRLLHCGNRNLADDLDQEQKNIFYMPMGLLALAAELADHGYATEVFHSDLLDEKTDRERLFQECDVLGLDCHWINQAWHVLKAAEYARHSNPDLFIFVGGFSASFFSTEIVRDYPFIDAVLRGDGEGPIVQLLEELTKAEEGDLSSVANLVYRDGEKIIENAFTFLADDTSISQLDFGRFSLLENWESYRELSRFWTDFEPICRSRLYLLEIGRGCTHSCTFCGGNCEAQYAMNRRKGYAVRSIPSVLKNIIQAAEQGFETFYTCFEFEESDAYYEELFYEIKKTGLKLNFVYGAWKLPSAKLIDTLSECFEHVILEISPETSSEKLRRENKDSRIFYTNRELEEVIRWISGKPNVKAQIYFGYYLIGDNEKTIKATIDYILRLAFLYQDTVEIEYTNFSTDPASLLFLHPEQYDVEMQVSNFADYVRFIKACYIEKKDLTADMRIFRPKNLESGEAEEIERKMKLFNYLFSYFGRTISCIAQAAGNVDFFMDLLEDKTLTTENGVDFEALAVKRTMIGACSRHKIFDPSIIRMAGSETTAAGKQGRGVKPVPKIRFIK